jgi:hypothetical protein
VLGGGRQGEEDPVDFACLADFDQMREGSAGLLEHARGRTADAVIEDSQDVDALRAGLAQHLHQPFRHRAGTDHGDHLGEDSAALQMPHVTGDQHAQERSQQDARDKPQRKPATRKVSERLAEGAQHPYHGGKADEAQSVGTHQGDELAAARDRAEALVVENEWRQHCCDQRRLQHTAARARHQCKRCHPPVVAHQCAEHTRSNQADEIEDQHRLAGHRDDVVAESSSRRARRKRAEDWGGGSQLLTPIHNAPDAQQRRESLKDHTRRPPGGILYVTVRSRVGLRCSQ